MQELQSLACHRGQISEVNEGVDLPTSGDRVRETSGDKKSCEIFVGDKMLFTRSGGTRGLLPAAASNPSELTGLVEDRLVLLPLVERERRRSASFVLRRSA